MACSTASASLVGVGTNDPRMVALVVSGLNLDFVRFSTRTNEPEPQPIAWRTVRPNPARCGFGAQGNHGARRRDDGFHSEALDNEEHHDASCSAATLTFTARLAHQNRSDQIESN
jgi:hypothetical protein